MGSLGGWRGRFSAGAILLGATIALIVGTGSSSGANATQCNGRPATITGTAEADTLYGTDGADVIVGGAGSDKIYGLGGDDLICGNTGNDYLAGGSGDDTLLGGNGRDSLDAGSGDDILVGDNGSDGLFGGSGQDLLEGDDQLPYQNDSCDGGDGSDDIARGDCETKSNVP